MESTAPRMSREEIMRRAAKLMAFQSGNATQAEIDNAAEKLGALLRENNISMSDVSASTIKSEIEEISHEGSYTKLPTWYVTLAVQITKALSCSVIICSKGKHNKYFRIIGMSADARVASFFLDVCGRELPLMEKRANPYNRISYLMGVSHGIGKRLRAMYLPPESTSGERGLILTKETAVTEYKENKFPKLGSYKCGNTGFLDDSYACGLKDSEKVSLNHVLRHEQAGANLG